MAYKILYIDDNATASRASDLMDLGYEVVTYDPSSDLNEMLSEITPDIDALVLDYRLTKGEKKACFDAPTIAQTIKTKNQEEESGIPIILMSNEGLIVDYYKNLKGQDLFDFVLTKDDFSKEKEIFKIKLDSFIEVYKYIKNVNYNVLKILAVESNIKLLDRRVSIKLNEYKKNLFKYSNFIYKDIVKTSGLLINEDVLSARLGVSKESVDWPRLLDSLKECKYEGVFSDIHNLWWMDKVNTWWKETVESVVPLRRIDALDRVEIIKDKLQIGNIDPVLKTQYSESSNFWTICKHSKAPLDPFDGIELLNTDLYPWQEKEYLSFDSALNEIDIYKEIISKVDKKAVRELAQQINKDAELESKGI